ncbi:LysE family translocator [Desulfopila sp. IMCC35008]|uniref:LysE family translocator n=1 Tax=Desulfopila sp. IMCC35008 TaxID=2653858 RepID=UPI0013D2D1A2|nr:LysE family translocator [Desulfopila sp. IMCC35008]
MTCQSWLIYMVLVLVATATPGPAVFYVMTTSVFHGWKKALYAAAGNITGLLCLGVLAVTGLGAIIQTSQTAFTVIKYVGAAYLVYLGIRLFRTKSTHEPEEYNKGCTASFSAVRTFIHAYGVAMSNPKAIIFLTALFPQFIDTASPVVPQFSILISTLMVMSFLFLMTYAALTHNARNLLTNPGRMEYFNRATGSVFIGFGLLLATSQH